MSQWIEEHSSHIYIRFFCIPGTIMATTKARYEYFACDLDRIVLVACLVKSIFDPIDYLISNF